MTLQEKIEANIEKTTDGCWNWLRTLVGLGYGQTYWEGKKLYVHRASYIVFRGEIPEGMHIDHLCRNTRCVNPDHLEPVTQRENNIRSYKSRGKYRGGPPIPIKPRGPHDPTRVREKCHVDGCNSLQVKKRKTGYGIRYGRHCWKHSLAGSRPDN